MLQERAHPAFTFVYNYRNMQVTALWSYEQSAMYLHLYEPHVWFGKTFTSDALPDVTSPIYVSLGSTLGVHLLVTWVCNAWLYWFNLKRMMSCQLELESLLPLMQKKTPIYRWALRDTQTDYNVENMCVCVVSTVFMHPKNKFCGSCVLIILLPQSLLQPSRCLCVFTYHSVCDSWDRLPDWHCWL